MRYLLQLLLWAAIEASVDVRVGELGVSISDLLRDLLIYCELLDW